MSRKFKIRDQEAVHFVTFTISNGLMCLSGLNTEISFLRVFDIAKRTKDLKYMPIVL
jgi:hypothetical protein